jgi:hypothetical protein
MGSDAAPKSAIDRLLYAYFAFIGVLTLFNPNGHTPIPLVIAGCLALVLFLVLIREFRLTIRPALEDYLLVAYVVVSLVTFALHAEDNRLNILHVGAELAVLSLYYFAVKTGLYNSRYFLSPDRLVNALRVGALVITISGFVDYALLVSGVNMATFLKLSQANSVAGSGIFSRARSFLVEPTDYALCLNSLFPILLFHYAIAGRRKMVMGLAAMYFVALITTVSAAGIASLAAGCMITYLAAVALCDLRGRRVVLVPLLIILVGGLAVLAVQVIFGEYVTRILVKLSFSEESGSAVARIAAYRRGLEWFWKTPLSVLIGNGTGFISGEEIGSTTNWYFSILAEKGITGLLAITFLYLATLVRILRIRGAIKYGLLISFCATAIHYASQTGFYFPFLWLLLVLSQFFTDRGELVLHTAPLPGGSGEPSARSF